MEDTTAAEGLPLSGLRVLDFGHTVMGPTCGLILADLGAEVIRVEPPEGDRTRRMYGFARGFFATFNRNKRSIGVDLKHPEGRAIIERLLPTTDVLIENFAAGAMDRLGLGWEQVREVNPRLIYCSLKGFLPGPYEHLPSLDEVAQMQGGLAYMTGPPGQPLRAGSSVVDITGGVFGAIAILAALRERDRTGKGRLVRSALFESVAFLVAQHMAYTALTGQPVPPMPARQSAWSVYNVFETADAPVFVAVTSDAHWRRFCEEFRFLDLLEDPTLATNDQRIAERERLMPRLRAELAKLPAKEVIARCNAALVPAAPVNRPQDLFEDPHLRAGGAMAEVALSETVKAFLPLLPIAIEGVPLGVRHQPPKAGEATREVLATLGYDAAAIEALAARGVIGGAT
ncbi:MAG: CoA transferase [Acetobacteraceae bacterium]|nr:CoA transferase [Acetobacteraceae bacterium]